ncbi:MAG: hypothetical protein HY901_09310 [Deltaproteobacteria bacterium]|nr:hypothetical protein [Deltaproteobacteria bacterium]
MPDISIPEKELNSFDLPRVCVISGEREGVVFKPVKFAWYPRWVPILVLVNLLVAAIVALILTKRAKGELPFTEKAYRRWRLGTALFVVSAVFLVLALFVSLFQFASEHPGRGGLVLLLAIGAPIGTWFGLVRNKNLVVQRIENGVLVLRTPSAAAAQAFEQHLQGGRSRTPATEDRLRPG